MTDQNTNGAVGHAASRRTGARAASRGAVRADGPPASRPRTPEITAAELGKRMELIREVKRTAMREGVDYGTVPGTDKPGLFKPGAEKLAVLFQLDVQPRNEPIWGPGEHLTVISRATVYHVPTGARLGYGEGICSSRERNRAYRKQERTCPNCGAAAVIKGKEEYGGGWRVLEETRRVRRQLPRRRRADRGAGGRGDREPRSAGHLESGDEDGQETGDVDAVMSVTGASAIFTQDLGADPTEMAAPDAPYGPVVPAELKEAARQAAIRLCGGEPAQAKALWEKIQDALDGYMPEAAAQALMLAAQAAGPPAGATAAGQPSTAPPAAAAPAASGQTQDPAPAASHAGEPANGNAHGARLRVIAGTRGVGHAELANLIRNAVGQGPIPADRAQAALPTMLERISEENSERTAQLIDMFYPPPEPDPRAASGEVTSVDFGAIEPPRPA